MEKKEKCNHKKYFPSGERLFTYQDHEGFFICRKCNKKIGLRLIKKAHDKNLLIEVDRSKQYLIDDLKFISTVDFEVIIREDGYIDLENNQSSSIDQTSIINNQASKIAAQEAEIKRLEKIIINQAEIIGKGSNA